MFIHFWELGRTFVVPKGWAPRLKMTPPPHSCLRFEPSNRPIDHMDKLQEQPDASLALMQWGS